MAKKPRQSLKVFLPKMLLVGLIIWGGWHSISHRFTLGVDQQGGSCLPFKYFLIDNDDHTVPTLGYVAFLVDDRVSPYFPQGSKFIKQVRGQKGDHVQIKDGQVLINGQEIAVLDAHILSILKRPVSDFNREFTLQSDDIWVMGTSKDAFDSRYWGPIHQSQIVGQVYPII